MNLFDKAKTWLPAMLQSAAGSTVSYRRGATSITLTAVIGQTVFSSNVEGAARIERGDRDYLILVADLTLGVPRIGDRITDANGLVFEVQTPETGEPAWRYSDPERAEYRLHMKRVT